MELKPEWFENSYQNKEEGGKKEFLILWLHAYEYAYDDVVVQSKIPEWAFGQAESQAKETLPTSEGK